MNAFTFLAPPSGAINFRGITGTLTARDRIRGRSLHASLSTAGTLADNRLIVQCNAGRLASSDLRPVYNQAQFFITGDFNSGVRIVTGDFVKDSAGKKIGEANDKRTYNIGFELDCAEATVGPHIWVAWMVSTIGSTKLTVLGDGKKLKSADVNASAFDYKLLDSMKTPGDITFKSHIAPKLKDVVVGDVVTIPFTLTELQGISELQLKVG